MLFLFLLCNAENIISPVCESNYKKLSNSSDNGKAFSLKDNILRVSNDDREIGCIILELNKKFWKYSLVLLLEFFWNMSNFSPNSNLATRISRYQNFVAKRMVAKIFFIVKNTFRDDITNIHKTYPIFKENWGN